MTKRDWLSVAFKTTGVVLVILYLSSFFSLFPILVTSGLERNMSVAAAGLQMASYAAAVVCGIVLGILLVTDGDRLADRLLKAAPEETGHAASAEQPILFWVALKLVGVGCIAQAAPRLFFRIGFVFGAEAVPEFGDRLGIWVRQVTWPLVLLAIGIWFVLGGKSLMRLAYGRVPLGSRAVQPLAWKPRTLFSAGVRVFGVVLLTLRLPWLISVLMVRVLPFLAEASENVFGVEASFNWGDFLGGLLILAIGVYFVSGAEQLVNFVFRKREADSLAVD